MQTTERFPDLSEDEKFSFVCDAAQFLGDAERRAVQEYKQLQPRLPLMIRQNPKLRGEMQKFKAGMARCFEQLREAMEGLRVSSGLPALDAAREMGVLDIKPSARSPQEQWLECVQASMGSRGAASDRTIPEFMEELTAAVFSGVTQPLLDDQVSDLFRAAIPTLGTLSDIRVAQAKEASYSFGLFDALPRFDLATVDEVLDIRRALAEHLSRFRSEVATAAATLKAASWEPEFQLEFERAFRMRVAPILEAIETARREDSYLMTLGRKLLDSAPANLGIAFACVTSMMGFLPAWQTALVGVGSMGVQAVKAADEILKRPRDKAGNLYFYYAAGQRIARAKR